MKIKSLILSLLLTLTTFAGSSQNIDNLSREQVQQLMSMICQQMSSPEMSQSMGKMFGPGAGLKADIVNDNIFRMQYTVPGYELDNSPEEQALTEVCIMAGGKQNPESYKNFFTQLLKKGGFNMQVVYTDGGSHQCVLDLTPDQIYNLWSGNPKAAGLNPELAKKGLLKTFSASMKGMSEEDISYSTDIEDKWLLMGINYENPEGYDTNSFPSIKSNILEEYRTDPTVAMIATILSSEKEFMGVDGLKIRSYIKGVPDKEFTITWEEMTNN